MSFEERLEKIEAMLVVLVERQQVRDWYTTEEFAQHVGKAEFTVREWCRLARVNGKSELFARLLPGLEPEAETAAPAPIHTPARPAPSGPVPAHRPLIRSRPRR